MNTQVLSYFWRHDELKSYWIKDTCPRIIPRLFSVAAVKIHRNDDGFRIKFRLWPPRPEIGKAASNHKVTLASHVSLDFIVLYFLLFTPISTRFSAAKKNMATATVKPRASISNMISSR